MESKFKVGDRVRLKRGISIFKYTYDVFHDNVIQLIYGYNPYTYSVSGICELVKEDCLELVEAPTNSEFKVGDLVNVEERDGVYRIAEKSTVEGLTLPVYPLERVHFAEDNILAYESCIKAIQLVKGTREKLSDTISIETEEESTPSKVGSLHFEDRDAMCRALNADRMYSLAFHIDQELRNIIKYRNDEVISRDELDERLVVLRERINIDTNDFANYE